MCLRYFMQKFLYIPPYHVSNIVELWLNTKITNTCDGLVGFKGGSKSLSVLKTAAWETYTARRISPSYQLRSVFGLLKASCISYFHAYLLRAPNSSRLQVWNFHGTTEIIPLDLDALDGPPNSPRRATRPWLPHRQLGCRRGKASWWFCWCAEHLPRPGRDGKQSVKRITRGKNITQSSPRRHSGNTIRVVNLTELLTDSANIARKKHCRLQNEIQSVNPICVWACLSSL